MRRFLAYSSDGDIKSVFDAPSIPEGVESPFVLSDGEFSLEVLDAALVEMPLPEFHRSYKVNVKTKKLVKQRSSSAK